MPERSDERESRVERTRGANTVEREQKSCPGGPKIRSGRGPYAKKRALRLVRFVSVSHSVVRSSEGPATLSKFQRGQRTVRPSGERFNLLTGVRDPDVRRGQDASAARVRLQGARARTPKSFQSRRASRIALSRRVIAACTDTGVKCERKRAGADEMGVKSTRDGRGSPLPVTALRTYWTRWRP